MKITLIGTLPPIKGISEYCIEQTRSLSKKVDVEFINFKFIYPEFLYPGGTKEFDSEFTIQPNKKLKIRNILTWYNPFSWFFAGLSCQGDLLHIHWWTFYLFPIFFIIAACAKIRGKKILLTVHNVMGHESGKMDVLFSRLMYRMVDALIVHSDINRRTLMKRFLISSKNIFIIPYSSLTFYNQQALTKRIARKYFRLRNNQKVILFFGTIRNYKGVDILLKAFRYVVDRDPQVVLIIAGKNWIDWKPYQMLISNLHLHDNIILHLKYIPTSRVAYYFKASDLVVIPYTRFDSQSGPGNIALFFKRAMVVSSVGGLTDLVRDTNVIVKPGDTNELANAIIYSLKDKNKQKKLENDTHYISRVRSWDRNSIKTIYLYKQLCYQH